MGSHSNIDTLEDQLELYDASARAALQNILDRVEYEALLIIAEGRQRLIDGHVRHGAQLFTEDRDRLVDAVRRNIGDAIVVEAARMNQRLDTPARV